MGQFIFQNSSGRPGKFLSFYIRGFQNSEFPDRQSSTFKLVKEFQVYMKFPGFHPLTFQISRSPPKIPPSDFPDFRISILWKSGKLQDGNLASEHFEEDRAQICQIWNVEIWILEAGVWASVCTYVGMHVKLPMQKKGVVYVCGESPGSPGNICGIFRGSLEAPFVKDRSVFCGAYGMFPVGRVQAPDLGEGSPGQHLL